MSVTRIRAHHEVLGQIAQSFTQQAEAVRQSLHDLREKQSVLQNGDWRGESATKFYAEMDERVLPAVQRLAVALEKGASITQQASRIMKQAEEESARLFKTGALGGPLAAGGSAGVGPGMAALADKGGGGAGSNAGGGSGSGSGSGPSGGGGAGPTVGNPKASSVPFQADLFSKLPPDVQKIAEKSPTLMKQLQKLKDDGWTVMVSPPPAAGTKTDVIKTDAQGNPVMPDTSNEADTFPEHKIIRIYDKPGTKASTFVDEIAHEVGHGIDNPKFLRPDAPKMDRKTYVDKNLKLGIDSEAKALFNELKVRDEILKNKGPDIGVSDQNNLKAYTKAFKDLKPDKAIEAIRPTYDKARGLTDGITDHFDENWEFWDKNKKVNDWN